MFSYFFMKALMSIIKLFEAPKRNVFKSKKCVFSSSRIGTGRVKDILQTAYFANIHDFRSKCNLFNCTIPIMHNHAKSIYRRCSEELFYHYHHHWIISFWTFAVTHHSIYTSKRNSSNSHSSQDRGKMQCIKNAYWIYYGKHRISTQQKRTSEMRSNIKKGRTKAELNMFEDQIRANDILQQPCCNSWSNFIPTEEFNYNLNKKQLLSNRNFCST